MDRLVDRRTQQDFGLATIDRSAESKRKANQCRSKKVYRSMLLQQHTPPLLWPQTKRIMKKTSVDEGVIRLVCHDSSCRAVKASWMLNVLMLEVENPVLKRWQGCCWLGLRRSSKMTCRDDGKPNRIHRPMSKVCLPYWASNCRCDQWGCAMKDQKRRHANKSPMYLVKFRQNSRDERRTWVKVVKEKNNCL